jgi:hypothetical protein
LRIATIEVEVDRIAFDSNFHFEIYDFVGEPVEVEEALHAVDAVGDVGDFGAGSAVGVLDDFVDTDSTCFVRGDLGSKVTCSFAFRAYLREHEWEQIIVKNVDMVRKAGGVPDELILPLDGGDKRNVVQVNATAVRIVRKNHVAGPRFSGP